MISYRALSNAYDAWNVSVVDRYIRDLVVYGTNQIELVAPDGKPSPHFPISQQAMIDAIAQLCVKYDLNVSLWYPFSLSDTDWGSAWSSMARLDSLFVPGGDPGSTAPVDLLPALGEIARKRLFPRFPHAQFWLSNQGFNASEMAHFYNLISDRCSQNTDLDWLYGVVYGPHTLDRLSTVRKRVPSCLPIRLYPDVCHQLKAQFPQPDWTPTFALTEARESVNPRLVQMVDIFKLYLPGPLAVGFGTYSDGATDDVNMMLWSALGWDAHTTTAKSFALDYSTHFVAPQRDASFASQFADVLLRLEVQWHGQQLDYATATLSMVDKLWAQLNSTAPGEYERNWRFQSIVYRAYYDVFQLERQAAEAKAESTALSLISNATLAGGSFAAMDAAQAVLQSASSACSSSSPPARCSLRTQCFTTALSLFHSIGMQFSIEKPFYADSLGRSTSLDTMDVPLNNIRYLLLNFDFIRKFSTEKTRVEALYRLATRKSWAQFYDNLGNVAEQPHLVAGEGVATDPSFYASALSSFTTSFNVSTIPVLPYPWYSWAESFYDAPLQLRYTGLDTSTAYVLFVVLGNGVPDAKMRLTANQDTLIHDYIAKPSPQQPLTFELPQSTTSSGTLLLSWTQEPGSGGNGRGCQVSEVWLNPKTT